jgi:hypothetical protein
MKKKLPISVVCASHNGRKKIPKLINSIFLNTHWPSEIIICGTNNDDFGLVSKKKYHNLNIKKIISKIKNQTTQRELAIKKTTKKIIIQCDDDIELDKNFIYLMNNHFKKNINKKKIVSAKIIFKNNKHQAIRWNAVFKKYSLFRFILFFLNKGQKINFMSILKSGRIIPRLPDDFLKKNKEMVIKDLQWVCSTVAYNKKCLKDSIRLQINNSSKAFYEDIFFSHSLYQKGYNLLIDGSIIAYHPLSEQTNLLTFLKTISSQWKIVKTFNKSVILFFFDVIIFTLIFTVVDLLKIFKKKR